MQRYRVRSRILASLDRLNSLADIATDIGMTDARLLWHLRQMRGDHQVESDDDVLWTRTAAASPPDLPLGKDRESSGPFPDRVIDDFNDAIIEAADGLYGDTFVLAAGEHRGRLSTAQASEFRDRLMSLIEEYFAPGRGDRTGIKCGFHWVLTPIDLHPLDDE